MTQWHKKRGVYFYTDARVNMNELLEEANALFVDENYEDALGKFEQALKLSPNNPDIYAKRANCYFKLEEYICSVQDACRAAELSKDSNQTAHFRRGVAAFSLGEYESALEAFTVAQEIKASSVNNMWIRKCNAELEEAPFAWQ